MPTGTDEKPRKPQAKRTPSRELKWAAREYLQEALPLYRASAVST